MCYKIHYYYINKFLLCKLFLYRGNYKIVSQEKYGFSSMYLHKSLKHAQEWAYNVQFQNHSNFSELFLNRPDHLSFRYIHFYLAFFVLVWVLWLMLHSLSHKHTIFQSHSILIQYLLSTKHSIGQVWCEGNQRSIVALPLLSEDLRGLASLSVKMSEFEN